MNKLIKQTKAVIYILCMGFTLLMCVPEKDFAIPPLVVEEPSIKGPVVDIEAVLGSMYQEIEKNGENAKLLFTETDNYMVGYLVSSDKGGNFFKELILQNQNINPTSGVRLLIDNSPLYTSYQFGQKVYVKLDGLSIGIQNGVPTLGFLSENTVVAIPSFSANDFIVRSPKIFTITPLEIEIQDFTDKFLNLYIKTNPVQFTKSQVLDKNTFTLAAEPNDIFNGERIIESCTTGSTTIMSTSTFSDFKGLKLPKSQGSCTGVLTKNFKGNAYNLVLNDPEGLVFDIETRCDPEVLQCSSLIEENTALFQENFMGFKKKDLEKSGWINTNVTNGKLEYKIGDFAENQYVQITGFRSKEPIYEIWLISPEIDLSKTNGAILNFDIQSGYDNGNILEVFVTTNFNEDIHKNDWIKLDAAISKGPLNSFGVFSPAGPINLSCIDGLIRIGFKYTGGDPRATTRYHIDNFIIKGNLLD